MNVALVIQHAVRMSYIILSSVVCLLYHIFFPHYVINGTIFGKKTVIENEMYVLIFFAIFEKILILRIIQRDIIINVLGSSFAVHLVLVRP